MWQPCERLYTCYLLTYLLHSARVDRPCHATSHRLQYGRLFTFTSKFRFISIYYVHKLDAQRKSMPYVAGYGPGLWAAPALRSYHHHHHIYSPQNKHKHTKKISEAGCQKGTNAHQRWPPLQLNDIIRIHKCTKKYKKKKNTASTQADNSSCAEKKKKKISRSQHTAQTVLTCPHITTGLNGVLNTFVTLRSASNCEKEATAERETRDTRTGI